WPLAALAYLVAFWAAEGPASRLVPRLRVTGNLKEDLRLLEAKSPAEVAHARVARLEVASIAAPLAGISLVLPLSVHFLFAQVLPDADFRWWITVSLLVVGHAHVAVALSALMFAREMKRTRDEDLHHLRSYGWKALGVAAAAAAMPGALLMFVPPLLVVF